MYDLSGPQGLVRPDYRAARKKQRAFCVWFTGLSGAGKSTLAVHVEQFLHNQGRHTFILDGDHVRAGLCRDLSFSEADRRENIRRVAEVARLMVDAGLIVLVSFISPFRRDRDAARALFPAGSFYEVFVETPLAECERRDVKQLYAKARQGLIPQFTGIDSPYEAPISPELRIDTSELSINESVVQIICAIGT
jgi:bifunctional enzyme CysN/CysC